MKMKWLQSLGGVDDQFVTQAAPSGAVRPKRGKAARLISVIAACLVFALLAGTLALFIPYGTNPLGIIQYANSDYYEIIQKLNAYANKPYYKNTFELLLDVGNMFLNAKEQSDLAAGDTIDPGENGHYQEVTDNQVSGVIEADRIKRSDSHIFYLAKDVLYVYSIEGQKSQPIAIYNVAQYGLDYFYTSEFFLSLDCKTLTIIGTYGIQTKKYHVPYVKLITLDVSDPADVKEISNVDVSGSYLSSRLTEHGLLLMTTLPCADPDFSDERTFLPQVETADGTMQSIAPDSIICPDALDNASYTVMLLMDATGTTVKDSAAFLSYSESVYVSANAIYATRSYREYGQTKQNATPWHTISEISCLGYGADGFEMRGSVVVDGSVLNQYSMDEYNGMLRVVTTTSQSSEQENEWGLMPLNTSADLYVIDLTDMEIIASVTQFAPVGEEVRSARFDGDVAYVCTAIRQTQTDPVFMFDLSDLDHITFKETGTIAGFSTSLVNFADGYLLGIGQGGSWGTLKIEIYTEGETTVDPYCKFELENTEFAQDYKCYYIDRENGLVGIGIYSYFSASKKFAYIVLHFDGQTLTEVLRIPYGKYGSYDNMRGVYIDGYFYVLHNHQFNVEPLQLK